MLLQQNNFVIRMIQLSDNNEIISQDITDKIVGFTCTNSAPVLGEDNMKYKIMFSNLALSDKDKYVIFQVSINKEGKYYNPYLFPPIKNENKTGFEDGPDRALSYRIFNNNIDFLWMYFTRDGIDRILENFDSSDEIVEPLEYLKEYIPVNQEKI